MSFGLTGNVMYNPIVAAGITVCQSHICLIPTPIKVPVDSQPYVQFGVCLSICFYLGKIISLDSMFL